jgi:DNA-binding beta-propeller fold protein YncE
MNVARGGTQPGRRVTTLLLVCLATSVAIAAGARAVGPTTTLTPQGCVDDNDSGDDACAWSTNGLDAAHSVAVSPDGESVYAASLGDNAIVHLSRSATTGALTPAGCVDDNDPEGPDACAQSTDGLEGAASVAVSSDGESVYAAGLLDDAIVGFDRNTTTGELTPAGCVEDDDTGDGACAQSTDGLDGPSSVTVSPDGRSVYAASFTDDAIVRFDRDTTTGALTPASCVNDNDTGDDACALSTDGLGGPSGVAVSPSGSSVYAASVFDSAIAHLGVQTTFIPRPSNVPPSNQVSFGKVKKKKRKGTATLTVEVPGPGKLDLAKTGKVKSAEKRAEAKGPEKLAIKPRGRATMKLNRKGKAKVKAKVTFTPDGGEPNTRSRRLKLIKRG